MNHLQCLLAVATTLSVSVPGICEDNVQTVSIWPSNPPAWNVPTDPEADQTKPDGRAVAGRSVIRLGNVAEPELHLYPAKDSKTTVLICPGGGFSILAWDLEGTEIARQLQNKGVGAAVLKYRVPTRNEDTKWLAPVQDVQRSIAMIRGGAVESMAGEHVGVLGFSAGGHTSVRAALAEKRLYQPQDDLDRTTSIRPDFAALVYPAYLNKTKESFDLSNELVVTEQTPPMFLAHAFDDSHSCMGSVALFAELKRKGIPASLHVFSSGGHGFGGRDTGGETDYWIPMLAAWLKDRGF